MELGHGQTIGQTQADIFETFALGQTINNYIEDSFKSIGHKLNDVEKNKVKEDFNLIC